MPTKTNNSPKLYIRTFGCQMNEYDSNKIVDLLHVEEDLELTDNPEKADVILFNTCSVREKAQEKVFSDLGRIKHLKEENPKLIIGVGGCVASQEGKDIVKRAPYVNVVFGPQTLHRLPKLIQQSRVQQEAQVDVSFPEIEKFDLLPPPQVKGATAFVSVMEGCSKYCSFCVVPYTRGEEISRPFEDILMEVADLADQGVKEINLLGQNVNAYRGIMGDSQRVADFTCLLEYVHEIPGIERIRYTTSHPTEMTKRLIKAYESLPKLVSFLHLPVQSGSDRILAAMKRGYTTLEFKSIVRQLRMARPGMTFSSDFIVGFPGETEKDFSKTLKLIEEVQFDNSFSFIYSRRPGTPAASLDDSTTQETKQRHLQKLQALIRSQADDIAYNMIGTKQKILLEGSSKRNSAEVMGRTVNNRIVNCSAPAHLVGQMVTVEITDVCRNSLRGVLCYGKKN